MKRIISWSLVVFLQQFVLNAQQIRFFVEGRGGSTYFHQNSLINFADKLDVVSISRGNCAEVFFTAGYQGPSIWQPGLNLGYSRTEFGLEFNGDADKIREYFDFSSADNPNRTVSDYHVAPYYVAAVRNALLLLHTKRFQLLPYVDLGWQGFNAGAKTLEKIVKNTSTLPEEEYAFFQKFKGHAYFELGMTAELFRKRMGVSFAFRRSVGSVFEGGAINYLNTVTAGLRYNFGKFNVAKYKERVNARRILRVTNATRITTFGIKLNFPMKGVFTCTGESFYPNRFNSITVANSDMELVRDFPLLPELIVRTRMSRLLALELGLSILPFYTESTANQYLLGASTPKNVRVSDGYQSYTGASLGAVLSMYKYRTQLLQLVLGASAYLAAPGQTCKSMALVKTGVQYGFNEFALRLAWQRSFNHIKFETIGDRSITHFKYLELSIAYDLFTKAHHTH